MSAQVPSLARWTRSVWCCLLIACLVGSLAWTLRSKDTLEAGETVRGSYAPRSYSGATIGQQVGDSPSIAKTVQTSLGAEVGRVMGREAAVLVDATRPQFRQPVALALSADNRWLLSANRRSGTVSQIDLAKSQVAAEYAIGRQLADLVQVPNQPYFLAVDEQADQLIVLELSPQAERLQVAARLAVPRSPVAVVVSHDGRTCYVSSLWSRRLSTISLDLPGTQERADQGEQAAEGKQTAEAAPQLAPQLQIVRQLVLPYSPRKLLLLPSRNRLLVADGFAGSLGIVDTTTGQLELVRQLPAHNLRGLALTPDGKRVVLAHQILNDLAETSNNDVHWGVLMSNVLRWLVLDNLLDPQAELFAGSHVHLIGDSSTPGADPSQVQLTPDGVAVVVLCGDNEVGLGQEHDYSLSRAAVGRCPTAVAVSADGRQAWVANRFSDNVTILDIELGRNPLVRTQLDIKLGSQPVPTAADRGEMLFYDASLALDGWFSCHSCHTDGHANGLLNDNLSDRSFGAAKRVLSLLGASETGPWAWNGSNDSLEGQITKSIQNTMQGGKPDEAQVADLAAFVRTLTPPPPLVDAQDPVHREAIERGSQLFRQQQCATCHLPPLFTSPEPYDVGLADKLGNRLFNPPSLRGVGHRPWLFHDNRARGLEEVFTVHRHQLQRELSPAEVDDLAAYLRSL